MIPDHTQQEHRRASSAAHGEHEERTNGAKITPPASLSLNSETVVNTIIQRTENQSEYEDAEFEDQDKSENLIAMDGDDDSPSESGIEDSSSGATNPNDDSEDSGNGKNNTFNNNQILEVPDGIQIHQNSSEAASVGAKAFTEGNNIHFATSQFKPKTAEGKKLIGHEMQHVIQQKANRVKPTGSVNGKALNDNAQLEREADFVGDLYSRGAVQFKAGNEFGPWNLGKPHGIGETIQRKTEGGGGVKASHEGIELSLTCKIDKPVATKYATITMAMGAEVKAAFKLKGAGDNGLETETDGDTHSAKYKYSAYKKEITAAGKKKLSDHANSALGNGGFEVVSVDLVGGGSKKKEKHEYSAGMAVKVKFQNGTEFTGSVDLFKMDDKSTDFLPVTGEYDIPIGEIKFWENKEAEASISGSIKPSLMVAPKWSQIIADFASKAARQQVMQGLMRSMSSGGAALGVGAAGMAITIFCFAKAFESIQSIKNADKKAHASAEDFAQGYMCGLGINDFGTGKADGFFQEGMNSSKMDLTIQVGKIYSHSVLGPLMKEFKIEASEVKSAIKLGLQKKKPEIFTTASKKSKAKIFPVFLQTYYERRADEWTTPEYIAFNDAKVLAVRLGLSKGSIKRKDGKKNKYADE